MSRETSEKEKSHAEPSGSCAANENVQELSYHKQNSLSSYDDALAECRQRFDRRDRSKPSPVYYIMQFGDEFAIHETERGRDYAEQLGWVLVGKACSGV